MTSSPMLRTTVADFLRTCTKVLVQAGIGTARLDCLVLMEDVLQADRAQLLAHTERELTPSQDSKLQELIKRRATHEPLAYLRHKTEFYGREFYIDHRVLEPRPESETMVDMLKGLTLPSGSAIADIGTGSGALAITAKLELPGITAIGIDIDPGCLKVASRNAHRLGAAVRFVQGDLLEPLRAIDRQPIALLCNLPYVPDSFRINPAAMREPRLAIFGGPDGLDLYRKLFLQVPALLLMPKFILTEAMPPQHGELTRLASAANYTLTGTNDFIQLFTVKDPTT